MSKSSMIRELYDQGLTISEIAEKVGVRYQFAYNVVSRLCSKRGEEVRKAKEVTTSQQIRDLLDQGYKVGEIAKKLNTNYVFVHQVARKYQSKKNAQ